MEGGKLSQPSHWPKGYLENMIERKKKAWKNEKPLQKNFIFRRRI
jgi:hypothetical protein